jgi:hypothetical protein
VRIYRSGHGPIALMSREERDTLEAARDVLALARQIESDEGQLSLRCYPEIAAAESALEIELNRQTDLLTNEKIQREAVEYEKV